MAERRRYTGPYGTVESWVYDRIVAPSMAGVEAVVLDLLVEALSRREGPVRCLDVGSGGGQTEASLVERCARREGGMEIVALEPSARLTAYARRRTAGLAVSCVQAAAQHMPLAGGSFGLVFSVASLKHWPDPARGLAECVRVLAPGGTLLVFEANRGLSPAEVKSFVRTLRLPFLFKPFVRRVFQSQVSSLAFDQAELRGFVEPLAGRLEIREIGPVEGTPLLVLRGVKSGGE